MTDSLQLALSVAASGLHVQAKRLLVVSENLANVQSTAKEQGGEPYARQVVSFVAALDEQEGVSRVRVAGVDRDEAPFFVMHEPGHPAADEDGNVLYPNVNVMTELADMREANRTYEANLQVVKQARDMISQVVDLLRSSR